MSEATTADVAPPARKAGLLIIILAAVLAVGIAGGAIYFFTAGKGDDAAATDEKAGGKKAADKKSKAPAVYVKLDPPFVANFEAKGQTRFLQVSVEIMTRDPLTADLLKLHDPIIRNDLLMLFGSQQYETISTHEGKDKLRAAALLLVAKIVTAEGGDAKQVEQVYFTSFVMQ